MTLTKVPYLAELTELVPPPARLLDYGCGIGSDGLALIEAGYEVEFADFDNPSTRYLRWRLERRGLQAPVHDLDRDRLPGGYDVAYAFDVIEHVEDPFAFLARIEATADLVAINFLEPAADDVHVHKPLPIKALLRHCTSHGLVHYSKHYGRSHFVIYHSQQADLARRTLGLIRRRA
jgi:hypothetical protein